MGQGRIEEGPRDPSQRGMTLTATMPQVDRGSPDSAVPRFQGWLAEDCSSPSWLCLLRDIPTEPVAVGMGLVGLEEHCPRL